MLKQTLQTKISNHSHTVSDQADRGTTKSRSEAYSLLRRNDETRSNEGMRRSDTVCINIVFGSASDEWFYGKLQTSLQELGFTVATFVFSAHRNILDIQSFVKKLDGSILIAGASLAAALPAVLAGACDKPVIGIPVLKDTNVPNPAIDSFLSMYSLPKGVPVLVAPLNEINEIGKVINGFLKGNFERYTIPADSRDLYACYLDYLKKQTWLFNKKENEDKWRERWKKYMQVA